MKKFYFGIALLCLSVIATFVACNNNVDDLTPLTDEIDPKLQNFFTSNEFEKFSKAQDVTTNDFIFNKQRVIHGEKGLTVYCIPIQRKGNIIGEISIFSKDNNNLYRVLYEDWTDFSEKDGGFIRVTTGDNKYIASLKCSVTNTNKINVKITDVAPMQSQTRAPIENWPTSDDGWWDCTTNCYKIAKDACDSDPQCKMEYDLMPSCATSIAVACAGYCL